jgi:hypothetical protein
MKKYVLVSIFAIAALACQWSYAITEFITPSGEILFQDDFSDPTTGWTSVSIEEGYADYSAGGYRMVVNKPDFDFWARSGIAYANVIVEADAIQLAGAEENRMGVICRYVNADNFYYFVISSDGYYAVGKHKNGVNQLIGQDMMQSHAAIHTDGMTNHLRADCIGSFLIFYVNDQLVATTQDTDFAEGDIGLIAGSFAKIPVDVTFDHFVVKKP